MEESFEKKKQSDKQAVLYRLLRLQNRQNNFQFHDQHHGVNYHHFPLQTIDQNDLLKTFWKFITTHYFKKIDQEELSRLNYLRAVFQKYQKTTIDPPTVFNHLKQRFRAFWTFLQQILSPQVLTNFSQKTKLALEDKVWLKRMFVQWCAFELSKENKSKKIQKMKNLKCAKTANLSNKKLKIAQLKAEEEQLDNIINQIQSETQIQDETSTQMDNIDEQIQRLQKILESQAENNITLVNQIQARIIQEEEQNQAHQLYIKNGQNARCLQWLIHKLQEKQIAQSVSKITSCQKKEGEMKFLVEYQNALNLSPTYLKESALKRMNFLRQSSLLKFYGTGLKSLHTYITHNFSGFLDLCNHRMTLSKFQNKDYIQAMKKNNSLSIQLKQQFNHYEICHHCKFIYPPYMLVSCRFRSDKQSMPKVSQVETDLAAQISLQKSRVSKRFVTKQRNCLTAYAWIDEEYVCGRKYCFNCLDEFYKRDWMKTNNGICPFCEGICTCTRCMRNEKMNKLKSFFFSLGGDTKSLQTHSLIEKLATKKEQFSSKIKSKNTFLFPLRTQLKTKTKKIRKISINRKKAMAKSPQKTSQRCKTNKTLEEETQRWSQSGEKQPQKHATISRRVLSRRKKNHAF